MRNGKPHFQCKDAIWNCYSIEGGLFRIGHGYTVKQAWNDWKHMTFLCSPGSAAVWLGVYL